MQGYYNRPDATAARRCATAGCTPATSATATSDGFFFLVDRKKDMIIRGGENIYPREIEDVLLEHPDVAGRGRHRASRRSPRRGGPRRAGAGAPAPSSSEVERHCRERLAAFKVPSTWEVVDELPKTSTGKIDKKPLRERCALRARG